MGRLRQILFRLQPFLRRQKIEAELAAELRVHLEMATDANIAAGMSAEEARGAARREFGGVDQAKEAWRDERSFRWLEDGLRDLRYAGRMLRRSHGFTAAAVTSLALCIGANTTIFSMLYALVIRPLPFHQPEQLVEIYNSFPKVGMAKLASNLGQYLDFRDNAPAFAQLALWRLDDYTLGEDRGPSRISGAIATAEIFDLLGVQSLLGRFFNPQNHVPGADKVVVLTQSFWESHFQSNPSVLGRTLRLDGEPFEIIGVAPRIFEAFDARVRLIRPLSWPPGQQFGRSGYSPQLFGRIKPGANLGDACSQVEALDKRYYDGATPENREFYDRTGHRIRVDTVQAQRAEPVKTSLWLLQGGVLFVLLIGCVNVANLLLARSNARSGEFAMRLALGATRGAIARQVLVESALLTCLGAGCGLLLAWSGLSTANHFTAQLLPDALPFGLDRHVLGYTAVITAILTLLVGSLPVAHLLGGRPSSSMHLPGRGTAAGRSSQAVGSALLVAQVAFALMLLTGAGLLIRSFANVLAVDPGFDPQQVIGARIAVPANKEKSFPSRLEAALREIPGAESSLATATPFLLVPPYQVSMPLGAVELREYALPSGMSLPSVFYCGATPSYLKMMRIPLLEGRWFSESDMAKGRAVVVDESFSKRYFPGRGAVGQRLVLNGPPPQKDEDWLEIVGVVGNVRHNGVEDKSGQPFLYLPLTQTPFYGMMSVLIRTSRPVAEVVALLREKVATIDPELPVYAAEVLAGVISDSVSNRRGIMLLLVSFAGIALLLAAVGIYGMLAYDVSRRTREIGIRSAIGATRRQIVMLILRQGLWKTGLGVIAGLAGAVALSRFVTGLLFEVQPIDHLVYPAVVLLLTVVAAAASWLPARRAANVDPAVTLRAE
jgi:putative ABC transport system permease protein